MPNGQESFTVEKGIVFCAFLFSDMLCQIFDVFDFPSFLYANVNTQFKNRPRRQRLYISAVNGMPPQSESGLVKKRSEINIERNM